MTRSTLHTLKDWRGKRDVFVNGKMIGMVIMADELRGVVEYFRSPLRVHKHGKRLLTRRVRGIVNVTMR